MLSRALAILALLFQPLLAAAPDPVAPCTSDLSAPSCGSGMAASCCCTGAPAPAHGPREQSSDSMVCGCARQPNPTPAAPAPPPSTSSKTLLAPAPHPVLALVDWSAGASDLPRNGDPAPQFKTNHEHLSLLCVWLM